MTPPSDFDHATWRASLDVVEALAPVRLFVTHFGMSDDPVAHLAQLRVGLEAWSATARLLLAEPGTDVNRADRFHA